ncbi:MULTISPECIES: hypothetical protein [Burkholderia]|uniref:hypothetical protein n=1 Tax=Burkholderia TaxID=32008 RepID=UPI0006787D3C|nr:MULTISPECIES: hypothetical protein [Burkholderia]KWU23188.1 hypothetical protein AS149_10365 [Burkholderia cenocepacia]OXI76356.1 hypothetical protein CFB44_07950 [Burkholderia sp. AU31280]QRR13353.1 hypothetical protein GJG85_08025 [Burkholderia sp. MS389]RQV66969.1 hypothetical protein DF024_07985 [Burkholderia cenocepacia]CAG2270722.1 hypothetical protein BCCR75389_01560 [Burkholderia cenocepacia]
MNGEAKSSKLEIDHLDYRFTATLEITESGRTAVVDRQLESEVRSKTLGWIVFDRFLERNDFADEADARANIVDWLARLADPRSVASAEIAKARAVATGVVAADLSTAEIVGGVAIEIAGNLDWIDRTVDWFSSGAL